MLKLKKCFYQQNIAFEMEDDPFEVKLRDNYAVCYSNFIFLFETYNLSSPPTGTSPVISNINNVQSSVNTLNNVLFLHNHNKDRI